jgi:hypothetical protein
MDAETNMELFNSYDLSLKASAAVLNRRTRSYGSVNESANVIMAKDASDYIYKNFDIFLSHNFLDADVIYGLKAVLEESNFSVYVYWVDDLSPT